MPLDVEGPSASPCSSRWRCGRRDTKLRSFVQAWQGNHPCRQAESSKAIAHLQGNDAGKRARASRRAIHADSSAKVASGRPALIATDTSLLLRRPRPPLPRRLKARTGMSRDSLCQSGTSRCRRCSWHSPSLLCKRPRPFQGDTPLGHRCIDTDWEEASRSNIARHRSRILRQ